VQYVVGYEEGVKM